MRSQPLLVSFLLLSSLSVDCLAQGGRGAWRRPEEITNRVAAYFSPAKGPEAQGDKVAGLETAELVRAAKSAGQLTVLYVVDRANDEEVRTQFERQLFTNDELGISLRCFHCGMIDLAKEPALSAAYAKKAPMFVVFDADAKATEVPMAGYKPSGSALQKALEKAANGTIKPSLQTHAKQYGQLLKDLEVVLTKQKAANEKLAKARGDADKLKGIQADLDALSSESKKLLDKETALLQKVRMPERGASAERLGGWGRRDNRGGDNRGEKAKEGGEQKQGGDRN